MNRLREQLEADNLFAQLGALAQQYDVTKDSDMPEKFKQATLEYLEANIRMIQEKLNGLKEQGIRPNLPGTKY